MHAVSDPGHSDITQDRPCSWFVARQDKACARRPRLLNVPRSTVSACRELPFCISAGSGAGGVGGEQGVRGLRGVRGGQGGSGAWEVAGETAWANPSPKL